MNFWISRSSLFGSDWLSLVSSLTSFIELWRFCYSGYIFSVSPQEITPLLFNYGCIWRLGLCCAFNNRSLMPHVVLDGPSKFQKNSITILSANHSLLVSSFQNLSISPTRLLSHSCADKNFQKSQISPSHQTPIFSLLKYSKFLTHLFRYPQSKL